MVKMICTICGKETNVLYVFDICSECWTKGDKSMKITIQNNISIRKATQAELEGEKGITNKWFCIETPNERGYFILEDKTK